VIHEPEALMKTLPPTNFTLFVRTDFSDDAAWKAVCSEIRQPPAEELAWFAKWAELNAEMGQFVGQLQAHVEIVDDPDYANLAVEHLLECLPPDSHHTFLFVVDRTTISRPDHPILVVDLYWQRGRTFRAIPSQIQTIENNLSIANCDWEDFADHVDDERIYRGRTD